MTSLHFPSTSNSYSHLPFSTNQTFFSSSQPKTLAISNVRLEPFGFLTVASRQNFRNLGFHGGSQRSHSRIRAESSEKDREPMVPPYNVLITGSTKGIGYALAREFLKAGDNVLICSRSAERVESAVQNLREEFGDQRVWGTICDVRKGEDVNALVSFARDKLKYIDIWINNAGSNAYSFRPLAETSDEDLM